MRLGANLWLLASVALVISCLSASDTMINAARSGNDPLLDSLLAEGVPVDHPGPEGSTALYWAAAEGRTSTVSLLLDRRANPNTTTARGSTSLEVAAVGGHAEVVSLLLDAGARVDPQSHDYGSTPLMLAIMQGHAQVAAMLIDRGADLEVRNHAGMTALISAARQGRTEIVEVLVARGADLDAADSEGNTSLMLSAGRYPDIANLLLDSGATVDLKDGNDLSAMAVAAVSGRSDLVALLIRYGADVNLRSAGLTPLHFAARDGHAEVARILISHGADANAQTLDGETAMQLAEARGHVEFVEVLQESGATR